MGSAECHAGIVFDNDQIKIIPRKTLKTDCTVNSVMNYNLI